MPLCIGFEIKSLMPFLVGLLLLPVCYWRSELLASWSCSHACWVLLCLPTMRTLFINIYFIILHGCVLPASMPVYHMCSVLWSQNTLLNPLELKLQAVVSFYIGARNWILVPWKSSQCSQPQNHCSSFPSMVSNPYGTTSQNIILLPEVAQSWCFLIATEK